MKVSMPSEIRSAISRLAKKHKFSSESGFLQHLVRREEVMDKERDKLKKLLSEGLRSGVSDVPPAQFFEKLEERITNKDKK